MSKKSARPTGRKSNAKEIEIARISEDLAEVMLSDLRESLTGGDLSGLARGSILYEDLANSRGLEGLSDEFKQDWQALVERANAELQQWRKSLKRNDQLEFCNSENAWYIVKIVSECVDGKATVHFITWDSKYDTEVDLMTALLVPPNTFCVSKRKPAKPPAANTPSTSSASTVQAPLEATQPTSNAAAPQESSAPMDVSRSGRAIKRLQPTPSLAETKKPAKKTKRTKADSPDHNDWVCALCGMLEAPKNTDLILCDGPCRRSFHVECMEDFSATQTDSWLCSDCTEGVHTCFVCNNKGIDYVEVNKCSYNLCGKYYHLQCVRGDNLPFIFPSAISHPTVEISPALPLYQRIKKSAFSSQLSKTKNKHGNFEVETFSFRCPQHYCDTCHEHYRTVESKDITPCSYCPRAFHPNCIPPGSRFNSTCLVCPLHPQLPLPGQALPPALQKQALASTTATTVKAEKPVVAIKKRKDMETIHESEELSSATTAITATSSSSSSSSTTEASQFTTNLRIFFDQLTIPDFMPDANDPLANHFRLQLVLKEEVESTPQNFKLISKNNYDKLPPEKFPALIVPDSGCDCRESCGEMCFNKAMRIECCEMRTENKGELICCVGAAHCTNRALQRKQYVRTKVFREGSMGLGLKTLEFVDQGRLVIEYLGEIIDEEEMVRRFMNQRILTPSDRDYYVMELATGIYVDGKHEGNVSRFINHSCDPNCELQRWNVRGRMRIGIFAKRNIQPGEPLSYDYQFDTQEEDVFKCYCGTAKCRGTMAPNKKDRILRLAQDNKLSKDQRNKLIQSAINKEKARTVETRIEEEWSRSYTGKFIPGDIAEMRNGPVKSTFPYAQEKKIFLVRNVLNSTDFLQRQELLDRKVSGKTSDAVCAPKLSGEELSRKEEEIDNEIRQRHVAEELIEKTTNGTTRNRDRRKK